MEELQDNVNNQIKTIRDELKRLNWDENDCCFLVSVGTETSGYEIKGIYRNTERLGLSLYEFSETTDEGLDIKVEVRRFD